MAIDLTGSFFNITQQKISRGQDLNLDFSVVNSGDGDIEPFEFDIVLSQDGNIDADDIVIGTYEIRGGLAAGQESGMKSFRYKTPSAASSFWMDTDNTYTVGMRMDPSNDYFETDEDNNSNQGIGTDLDLVEVINFGDSDLVATEVKTGSLSMTPGDMVDLSFTVKNDSEEMANPFSIDIYLSNDDNMSADDVMLGIYDIRDIVEPGDDTGTKSFSYKSPDLGDAFWASGDGDYKVILNIDSENEVSEVDETNNLSSTVIDVAGIDDAADLIVSDFTAPADLSVGETVEVEYEVTNSGSAAAELFGMGFYLFTEEYKDSNNSLSVEDVPEVYFLQGDQASSLISLDPGESTMMTTELTIPEKWTGFFGAGDYYLGAEADAYDDVVEGNDFNNSLTGAGVDFQKVNIDDAPVNDTVDLVGTHFEVVQEQIVPGQLFDLGFTIENQGMADADPFYFDLYLSADATITEEDTYLGRYDIRDGLESGEDIGLKSSRYTAPAADDAFWNGDGEYYAGMIINPEQDIAETNFDNNSNQGKGLDYSSTEVVGLDTIADLKTESLEVTPDTIATGQTFEVTYEISNMGTASADLFAAGFYIFTEEYLETSDSLNVEDVPKVYFLQGDDASSLISLGADESVSMTTELTMPEDWAGFTTGSGEYYVGVAADPFGDVIEKDEMNNSLNGMDMDYAKVNVAVI